VCGDYTRALVSIDAGCMEILGMTLVEVEILGMV